MLRTAAISNSSPKSTSRDVETHIADQPQDVKIAKHHVTKRTVVVLDERLQKQEKEVEFVQPPSHTIHPPMWQSFMFSTVAPTIAAPFTNPFGVARTQLQAQKVGVPAQFTGTIDYFRKGFALEGPSAIQRGITPVLMREASMNLFRIGLYKPTLSYIYDEQDSSNKEGGAPIWARMTAGAFAGAIGAIACNPFEILRVRQQVLPLLPSGPSASERGTFGICRNILQEEGMRTLYRATGTSVALGMVCTSVNMSTYTIFREEAMNRFGMKDGPVVDISCALLSGFFSALAMNPIDVVRTRMISDRSLPPKFRNGFHAAQVLYQTEGIKAFAKGFTPSFLRIGPHFVITFLVLEQMRRLAHSYNLSQVNKEYFTNIFHSIDTDDSGDISKEELSSALAMADPFNNTKEAQETANKIFTLADTDHSGTIDRQEFLTAATASNLGDLLRGQKSLSIFHEIDIDHNGTIDEDELLQAIWKLRNECSPSSEDRTLNAEQLQRYASKIIDKLDKDGDRTINYTEFALAIGEIDELVERRVLQEWMQNAGVAQG